MDRLTVNDGLHRRGVSHRPAQKCPARVGCTQPLYSPSPLLLQRTAPEDDQFTVGSEHTVLLHALPTNLLPVKHSEAVDVVKDFSHVPSD